MAADAFIAILQGLQDTGIALAGCEPGYFGIGTYDTVNKDGARPRLAYEQSTKVKQLTIDGGSAVSSYQVAHCKVKPSPTVSYPEFPLQRLAPRRSRGNFEVRRSANEFVNRNKETTQRCRPSSYVDRGVSTRDEASFIHSLRRYPPGSKAQDLWQRMAAYGDRRRFNKSSYHIRKTEANKTIDNDANKTKQNGDLKKNIKDLKKKLTKEKNYESDQIDLSYDYLADKGKERPNRWLMKKQYDVRYLTQLTKNMRRILLSDNCTMCPSMKERYLKHLQTHHFRDKSQGTDLDIGMMSQELREGPAMPPFSLFPTCSHTLSRERTSKCCFCKKTVPCPCGSKNKSIDILIDQKIDKWIKDIPVFRDETAQDAALREALVKKLKDRLKRLARDDNVTDEMFKKEIENGLSNLPMWIPDSVTEQEKLKSHLADNLIEKLDVFKEDKDAKKMLIAKTFEGLDIKAHDDNGEAIDRATVIQNVTNKVDDIIKRKPSNIDPETYKDIIKPHIVDILKEQPLEVSGNLTLEDYIENKAEEISGKLSLIPKKVMRIAVPKKKDVQIKNDEQNNRTTVEGSKRSVGASDIDARIKEEANVSNSGTSQFPLKSNFSKDKRGISATSTPFSSKLKLTPEAMRGNEPYSGNSFYPQNITDIDNSPFEYTKHFQNSDNVPISILSEKAVKVFKDNTVKEIMEFVGRYDKVNDENVNNRRLKLAEELADKIKDIQKQQDISERDKNNMISDEIAQFFRKASIHADLPTNFLSNRLSEKINETPLDSFYNELESNRYDKQSNVGQSKDDKIRSLENTINGWIKDQPELRKQNVTDQQIKEIATDLMNWQDYAVTNNRSLENLDFFIDFLFYKLLAKTVSPDELSQVMTSLEALKMKIKTDMAEDSRQQSSHGTYDAIRNNPVDFLYNSINDWFENLPLDKTPHNKRLKETLANKLGLKITHLNLSPEVLNDDFLYESLVREAVEEILDELPFNGSEINKAAMANKVLNKIKEVKPHLQDEFVESNYHHQVKDGVMKALPDANYGDPIQRAEIEILRDNIADTFIRTNEVTNQNDKEVLETKLKEQVKELCQTLNDKNIAAIGDIQNAEINIIERLRKVSLPNEDAVKSLVKKAKIKDYIKDFVKDLPLRPNLTMEENVQKDKGIQMLAKRLQKLDEQNEAEPNDAVHKEKIAKAFEKFVTKLPLKQDQNIPKIAEKFANKYKETEPDRRVDKVVHGNRKSAVSRAKAYKGVSDPASDKESSGRYTKNNYNGKDKRNRNDEIHIDNSSEASDAYTNMRQVRGANLDPRNRNHDDGRQEREPAREDVETDLDANSLQGKGRGINSRPRSGKEIVNRNENTQRDPITGRILGNGQVNDLKDRGQNICRRPKQIEKHGGNKRDSRNNDGPTSSQQASRGRQKIDRYGHSSKETINDKYAVIGSDAEEVENRQNNSEEDKTDAKSGSDEDNVCVLPCSLTPEELDHLERIRHRYMCWKTRCSTDKSGYDAVCQTPSPDPRPVSPNVIVKEYYWDSSTDSFRPAVPCKTCSAVKIIPPPARPTTQTNPIPTPGSTTKVTPNKSQYPCQTTQAQRKSYPPRVCEDNIPNELPKAPCQISDRPCPSYGRPCTSTGSITFRHSTKSGSDESRDFYESQTSAGCIRRIRKRTLKCKGISDDDEMPKNVRYSDNTEPRQCERVKRNCKTCRRKWFEPVQCNKYNRCPKESLNRCSNCCGLDCPYPSFLYFRN